MQETFIIWNNSFKISFTIFTNSQTACKEKSFKAFWEFQGGLLAQI